MDLAKLALFDVILYCDGEFSFVDHENVEQGLNFLSSMIQILDQWLSKKVVLVLTM
jgi:hypothetical protein